VNSVRLVSKNNYVPDYLVTPGEVLEEYLEHAGLTQASLSDRTGLSKKTINEIVKAKSAITAETALKFERTLGRPAHFWSSLERQYQEDKTRLAYALRKLA
jgi:addiction module HigA family antidote